MWSRSWLMLGILAFPTAAPAQAVKEADVVGAWRAELEHTELELNLERYSRGGLVLWPDGLWWYGGPLTVDKHGGARWRLVGDTLWLANDYVPYFHPMIGARISAMRGKGHKDLGVMDMEVINKKPPYPVPDSIYWSPAFRDSTSACAEGNRPKGDPNKRVCGTWVYKVSMKDKQLFLVRLDSLSRIGMKVAKKMVLTRDSLSDCNPIKGC